MANRLASAFGVMLVPFLVTSGHAQSKGGQPGETATPDPIVIDAPACSGLPTGDAALVCSCAGDAVAGSVWGSNPYTGDSNICTAARHSGVIDTAGGVLQLVNRPGQAEYKGSTANGITTSDWGSYGNSFEVLAATAAVTLSDPVSPACPGSLGPDQDALDCSCIAGLPDRSVWGSDPYTADSDICTAARHAGYVDDGGGNIRVMRIKGLDNYTGSESNGVSTSDWSSFDTSIIFNWN